MPYFPFLPFIIDIHYCLGAPLARMEVTIALQVLTARISKLHIPEGAVLEPLINFNMLGLQRLPLKFAGKI